MADFADLQKKKRVVDWDYLTYIKEQPSCASGSMRVDPHHLKTVGAGGSDYCAIPLTRAEHTEIHKIGVKEFEKRHHVNVWYEAWRLLESYYVEKRDPS